MNVFRTHKFLKHNIQEEFCFQISVPADFHDILMSYTKHGYRVLALAYKPLPEKLKYTKLQRLQRY